jgi:hypothetical protein
VVNFGLAQMVNFRLTLPKGGRVRVEVYIDTGDKARNEQVFDCLLARKQEMEAALNFELTWERLDSRRACRIAVYRDGEIDADSETLADIKSWTIQNLLRFKAVFAPEFQRCV